MTLGKVLRSWEIACEDESYQPFLESVKLFLQTGVIKETISGPSDSKCVNSLLCAAFSESRPLNVRRNIMDLFHFLGSNLQIRCRLLTSFSILHPLVFALSSKSFVGADEVKLLKTIQLYTTDLHLLGTPIEPETFSCALKFVLNVVRQSKQDELIEPVLGILSNLSHFSDLVAQCLNKKDDFEILRKCLLRIMNSESVSQASLVFSMSIRFHLWRTADKFFEQLNVHKSLQILFKLLLNGEIGLSGLCAGGLLADMCCEPKIAAQFSNLHEFNSYLNEIIIQLKVKDSSLVLKLLHLLRRLLENGTDRKTERFIRNLFFSQQVITTTDGSSSVEPLETLFQLTSDPEDLIATAALDLLIRLVNSQDLVRGKENQSPISIPYERMFEYAVGSLQNNIISTSAKFRILRESANDQRSVICSRLLRKLLLIRLADRLVQCLQTTRTADALSAADNVTLDNIFALVDLLSRTVLGQFDGNNLINIMTPEEKLGGTVPTLQTPSTKADMASCLLSAGLAVEAMGLIFTCTDMLSSVFPGVSQEDEVSLTQPSNEKTSIDCKSPSSVARHCGQSLQTLLECPEIPGILALCMVTAAPTRCSTSEYSPLGIGLATRYSVIHLLSVALHLDKFDIDQFALLLNRLNSSDGSFTSLLNCLSDRPSDGDIPPDSFLSHWIRSAAGSSFQDQAPSNFSFSETPRSKKRPCESPALEQRIDRFLTEWEACRNSEVPSFASDLLSILQHKIHLLQSREDALEASASANAEALNQANRLCEHYRERLVIAEAESEQLQISQFDAVSRMEVDKRSLTLLKSQTERLTAELNDLRLQLTNKNEECQDLKQKNDSLQKKLNTAREENRAMDATIDDYRNQLDMAKEQIQTQLAQINKFTQITRLINDLTGNPQGDLTTVGIPAAPGDSNASVSMENTTTHAIQDSNGRTTTTGVSKRMTTRTGRR